MPTIEYNLQPQGEVLQQYNDCRSPVSFIMGPLGSGKTVQTITKIFELICEQKPVKDKDHRNYNVRLSRWIAVRNTYSELFSTTIKDWLEIHGDLGNFNQGNKNPPTHYLQFGLDDGTKVRAEMMFLAFDRPDHVKKARGIQATGIWLNEVKELPKSVIDMLDLRHGRYPSQKEGATCTWHGIVGDTNAPDEDHWYYEMAEEVQPKGWKFYRQAGGVTKVDNKWVLNPEAENLNNLPDDYYDRGMQGKTEDWIKVNLANEYGFVIDGKPVHPMYVDTTHCIDEFSPDKNTEIVLGLDFGRTPAAAFVQRVGMDRWVCFDEFVCEGVSAVDFAPQLKRYIDMNYDGYNFKGWGDPSGGYGNQSTDQTPFTILRAAGLIASPTTTNDPLIRRASLENPLKTLSMDGKPRFLLTKQAKMIRKGLMGGFCYRRIMVSGEKYTDEPDKNEYSHPVEALEYALQGEGEGRAALKRKDKNFGKPTAMPIEIKLF